MIKAVVFDMGGVLLSDSNVRARLAEFDEMLGQESGAMHARLYSGPAWEGYSTGAIAAAAYWQMTGAPFEHLLPADFPGFQDSFYGETLFPDMVELARRLRRHYRVALLSNATIHLPQRLAAESMLAGLFDVAVISAVVGMRKPQPEIYALTCERLNLPPAACVLVDDRERNTTSARAQGMRTIQHRNAAETKQALQALGVHWD